MESTLEELQEKLSNLKIKLSDLNQGLRCIYDELLTIPESKEVLALERKLDFTKGKREYNAISKKIQAIFDRKPTLREEKSNKEKLENEIKFLGNELSEVKQKLLKLV